MQSVDVFYYSLALGFIILSSLAGYALYELGNTLKSIKSVVDEVDEAAHDVNSLKNGLKTGVAKVITTLVGKWGRGGE